jgi:beta-mannosidase
MTERTALSAHWELLAAAPGSIAGPRDLPSTGWTAATAPSTAAAALRAAGQWSLDAPARRFDAEDWWWRTKFSSPFDAAGDETVLCFDGLATIADVWLDGEPLLSSRNMFHAHDRRLERGGAHELAIRFGALDAALAAKRPRPRWRAPMIENQQLRWIRTTLLGRTPGWSPPAAAVGPWREVRLERRRGVAIEDLRIAARLEGGPGVVELSCRLRTLAGAPATAEAVLEAGGVEHRAPLVAAGADGRVATRVVVPRPWLWWPHTHGEPACYRARLEVMQSGSVDHVALGRVGFRELVLDTEGGGFRLQVGGQTVFCRGACWTPVDPVALAADRAAVAATIDQVVAAGMNMVRVSGTMVYESDDFYDLCDERGVLVWQDFMFANMDYPDDADFVAGASEEARQILARLQARPSLAVLCGSSEGEQQAAMWGAPRELWSPRLFHEVLPALAADVCPGVPYWPSSAHGGAFPHEASSGTTSYYGVGAYRRPLEDARRSELKFASECLAFANVPAATALPGGATARADSPSWKARSPRDLGAGWDFDDVRDHYLQQLFAVDPARLRAVDNDRYLRLSRAVTGEIMLATFAEWRRARSTCRGALVWFLRDLWPGAGWGVIDANGARKAAYFYLSRALQPVALFLSDEGVNGLAAHVVNERPVPLEVEMNIALYRDRETLVGRVRRPLALAPRETRELSVGEWFEGFRDLSYAYRFGPPPCDVIVATLTLAGATIAEAFHFPAGMAFPSEADLGLIAHASARADGGADLVVKSRRFAQGVQIEVPGMSPDDDCFHIAPGGERMVRLRRVAGDGPVRGQIQALNAASATTIKVAT